MPTKISAQIWDGSSQFDMPDKFIGYCTESPQEVLRRVHEHYLIFRYKDVKQPVDARIPNTLDGLVIEDGLAPSGCKVVGSVDDLDLDYHQSPNLARDEDVYRSALRKGLQNQFEECIDGDFVTVIPDTESEMNYYQRENAQQLYEVMQVTLGIEEPGLDDLRELIKR